MHTYYTLCISFFTLHRGSYRRAHVLLNLLNESGKKDKMLGFPSVLSFFRNKFNRFKIQLHEFIIMTLG